MSDPPGNPWTDNPNAPHFYYDEYLFFKEEFAGYLISTIFYGLPAHQFIDLCSPYLFDHNPRNCCCSFLSMHERVAQSRNLQKECHQMGICVPHHSHVFGRDGPHRDKGLHSVLQLQWLFKISSSPWKHHRTH